jgi:hypothetical protein
MRIASLTLALLSMTLGLSAASVPESGANPYIKLTQVAKDGALHVTIKNISHKPVLAYVVAVEDGSGSTTHHDFFTGRSAFAPGKTVELVFALPSPSSAPKVVLDYVRLADKTSWGNPATDDGKAVAASFQD